MQELGTANQPQQLSPDGMWRWDGTRWHAVESPSVAARQQPHHSWLSTMAGIGGLVAVPFVLAGCIFPFVYYTDTSQGGPTSPSIFNLGYSGGLFYAIEPVAVMVLALAAAVLLIAVHDRIVQAVVGGVVLALGLQTVALFIGYIGGEVPYGRLGAGGPLGVLGGIFLVAAGTVALVSLFVRQRQTV